MNENRLLDEQLEIETVIRPEFITSKFSQDETFTSSLPQRLINFNSNNDE